MNKQVIAWRSHACLASARLAAALPGPDGARAGVPASRAN
jgi:hypothetical protein